MGPKTSGFNPGVVRRKFQNKAISQPRNQLAQIKAGRKDALKGVSPKEDK
jgi:hypothetical protein